MGQCKLNSFVAHIVFFLALVSDNLPLGGSSSPSSSAVDQSLVIKSSTGTPINKTIEGMEGEAFVAACSVNLSLLKQAPSSLRWMPAQGGENPRLMQTKGPTNNTMLLTIAKLNRSDAGLYKCVLTLADNDSKEKHLELHVRPQDDESWVCGVTRFRCVESGDCIFNRYMCDGVSDCPGDASDESKDLCSVDPCENKFKCNNSRCIDHKLVCDNADTCGDNSDEVTGCLLNSVHTTPNSLDEENEHFNWLKTTVYTVIGCTVATVMLISFIVIIVFRLKMKRRRAHRLASQLERHRRHHGAGDGASDQDPFLAFSTQSHYGNIIVNVNNGVQCVGAPSLATGFRRDKPPPYSEVATKKDFPPPPYSTIDRANQRARLNAGRGGAGVGGAAGTSSGSGSGRGSSPGTLFPVSGSGMAVIGPPLAHPARQQYLQRNSTGSQDGGGAGVGSGSRPGSTSGGGGGGEQRSSSTRNSAASNDGPASSSANAGDTQQTVLVGAPPPPPLPPPPSLPPPPPPPPPPPSSSSSSSSQQPSQQDGSSSSPAAAAAVPTPPPRSTSIVESQAQQHVAGYAPPLPPRNNPLPPPPVTPTSPLPLPPPPLVVSPSPSSSPSVGGGGAAGNNNLVVQDGKIVLTSPLPASVTSSSSLPSPSPSLHSTTSAAAVADKDRELPATPVLPPSGKIEVKQGKIILNVSGADNAEGGSTAPATPPVVGSGGDGGGGCELQVKDGKIIFKR